jgi:death-on-curing protein
VRLRFLSLDEILALHADQIERYGGRPGIRDVGLLQSALGMPCAAFEGRFLHGSLHEMAAAYLFHLVQNHPFVDGNKRVGLIGLLAFLGLNDHWLEANPEELEHLVLGVATGQISKPEVAVFVQRHLRPGAVGLMATPSPRGGGAFRAATGRRDGCRSRSRLPGGGSGQAPAPREPGVPGSGVEPGGRRRGGVAKRCFGGTTLPVRAVSVLRPARRFPAARAGGDLLAPPVRRK